MAAVISRYTRLAEDFTRLSANNLEEMNRLRRELHAYKDEWELIYNDLQKHRAAHGC